MRAAEQFFDTNVLLYLLSGDPQKSDRAEQVIAVGGVISVQVLNEFASVATRRLKMSIEEVREVLTALRAVCTVVPVSVETHDLALQVAERYELSIYDSLIAASALLAGCKTLWSEDMQDGQMLAGKLRIKNPFH